MLSHKFSDVELDCKTKKDEELTVVEENCGGQKTLQSWVLADSSATN
jgi:hypothetical protein